MNLFGKVINGVQDPVYPDPYQAVFTPGFNVDIAGTLVEGITEDVVYGVYDMLIV